MIYLCFFFNVVIKNKIAIERRERTKRAMILDLTFCFYMRKRFAICWFPIHLLELLNCQQMFDVLKNKFYSYYMRSNRVMLLFKITSNL